MKNKIIAKVIMSLLLILGGSGLCLADDKAQASDWYSPDWGYRKAITVNNTSNSSALTDYQVLVTLNSGDSVYAGANSDGSDLRFTDSDELTEISYWIKEWNNTGESKIYVKIPSIAASSTATIYLYYGNASATTSLSSFDDTMQKLEADADTVGLWHFDEGTGSTIMDSSGNGNNGTTYRHDSNKGEDVVITTKTDRWVADSAFLSGGALTFDPDADDWSGDYVEVAHDSSLNLGSANFTVEGWVRLTATGSYDMTMMSKYVDNGATDVGIDLYLNNIPDYSLRYGVWDSVGGEAEIESGIPVNDGNWHYIVALREGAKIKNYIDGEFEKEIDASTLDNIDNEAPLVFGRIVDYSYFNGQLDEFRVSTRALNANEIKANYERRKYTPTEPTNSLGTEEADPYDASETIVATDGGTVMNTADTAEVTIPADALSGDTEITIEAIEETGSFQVQGVEPVDYIYNFGPEGTEFSSPVTLTFNYDDTGMTVEEENSLDIYYYNAEISQWESQGATVDTTLNTLTLAVDHFSGFMVGMTITASSKIGALLDTIDDYSDAGEIRVEVNGEIKTLLPAYFLKVHLKRAQKLIGEGKNEKAITVLEKFIEKVERFTPHLINEDASAEIIIKTDEIIGLL